MENLEILNLNNMQCILKELQHRLHQTVKVTLQNVFIFLLFSYSKILVIKLDLALT